MGLRGYQTELVGKTQQALADLAYAHPERSPNVMVTLATGGGKTRIEAALAEAYDAPQIVQAHRQELVGQISKALAEAGLRHGIIAPDSVVSSIRKAQIDELGVNFVDQSSHIRVAGVDTLLARPNDPFLKRVKRIHTDEGHHVLKLNKWGRAHNLMPQASGIMYTATALRADGKGLGRATDGLCDVLIAGPGARQLMNWGYLTDYRYVCEEPPPDFDFNSIVLSADGDYNKKQLSKAAHESRRLVGDVVESYMRYAPGELGITFAVDLEEAGKLAVAFRARGIPAEVVSGKTPDTLRRDILARFRRKEVLQLINVDLFGEGFDVPAVKVVSLARPTKSFSLYAQQVGRVVRLMIERWLAERWDTYTVEQRLGFIASSEKPKGIVIDHVNNWKTHGMPDNVRRVFSLERRAGRSAPAEKDPNVIGLRTCLNPNVLCRRPYERMLSSCPYCGYTPTPTQRTEISAVDGDVFELDDRTLALLRGTMDSNFAPPTYPHGASDMIRRGIYNRHEEKLRAITQLRQSMATWCAGASVRAPRTLSDREQAKAFYLTFGVDVMTACSLKAADAIALRSRVDAALAVDNIVNGQA